MWGYFDFGRSYEPLPEEEASVTASVTVGITAARTSRYPKRRRSATRPTATRRLHDGYTTAT